MPHEVQPPSPQLCITRFHNRVATATSLLGIGRHGGERMSREPDTRRLRAAWASLIRKYDTRWTHVFTFQFAEPQTVHSAKAYFRRGWLPAVQKYHAQPLLWFASFE